MMMMMKIMFLIFRSFISLNRTVRTGNLHNQEQIQNRASSLRYGASKMATPEELRVTDRALKVASCS